MIPASSGPAPDEKCTIPAPGSTYGCPSSSSAPAQVSTLYDLAARLQEFTSGALTRDELEAWIGPILDADSLDVHESPSVPWEDAPEEERLYWRLLYTIETNDLSDEDLRGFANRVLDCIASTGSPADTLELLPLLRHQPRLLLVLDRHESGIISRVGLLGFVAKSGYPAHVKLWLEYAPPSSLQRLRETLRDGEYGALARMFERRPG